MPKYKQAIIPSVTTEDIPKSSTHDMKVYVKDYYTNRLQGKQIVNKHIGLTIFFGSDGKNELVHGRAMYKNKAALVKCLDTLLSNAEYNNFGARKAKDPKELFGYANFKAKVIVDGKLLQARITVLVKANGKAYYCHEISIKK